MIRLGSSLSLALLLHPLFAQTAPQPPQRVLGAIATLDAASKKVTVKTDAGDLYSVKLGEATKMQKVAPGEKDLKSATPLAFDEMAVGDRAIVMGSVSAENKTVDATRLIVMTKGDLAKKQEKEQQDWTHRGASGVIVAAKPASNEIVIQSKTLMGTAKEITVSVTPKTAIRQYAPDSVRFSDAKLSKLTDMSKDDQIRVRGEKSPEGDKIVAEEIIFGTFQLSAGTVTTIAANEIRIKDLKSKKTITVHITEDSQLRKLPEQMARMMAMQANGEGGVPGGGPGNGMTRPAGGGGGQGGAGRQGGGFGGGPGGGGRGGDMMDRIPKFQLADLKVGDAVMILHTKGAKTDELTAVSMLSGVEPILTAPSGRDPMAGMSGMMSEMGGMGGGGNQ